MQFLPTLRRFLPAVATGALALAPFAFAAVSGCAAAEADGGWVELFDGRTLDGWTTVGGRYDGHASWSVEDGAIVGREGPDGAGGLLYTRDAYRDFELELECKIDWPFDSGIFLRMAPEGRGAQVTIDYRPDGEVGAIYSDGFLAHNESGKERMRRGAWHHFRVRCTGDDMLIEAWLDGEPLVRHQIPEGSEGFAPTGLIGLQVHGAMDAPPDATVRFREVRVRRLGEDGAAGR